MPTRIIGIDFGTSTTVVRVHNVGRENEVRPLLVNGCSVIPTVAFRDTSGCLSYGYDAIAKRNSRVEGEFIKNFKMDLISKNEKDIVAATKLVDGFVSYIYNAFQAAYRQNQFPDATETKVYMSHPTKWPSEARNIMKQSVVKAGFCKEDSVSLKDEPTAAVLAVIHERENEMRKAGLLFDSRNYKAMMVDMGAGTTDIVLFTYRISNGKLELNDLFPYPTVGNTGTCGGREIDTILVEECRRFLTNMQGNAEKLIARSIRKFENRVTSWKEDEASSYLKDRKDVPEIEEISDFRDMLSEVGMVDNLQGEKFSLDRQKFEEITKNHWTSWAELIGGVFEEVSKENYDQLQCPKTPEDVQLLVLTGGHSQWYIAGEYLRGEEVLGLSSVNLSQIRNNPGSMIQSTSPQETVAVGLCYLDDDLVSVMPSSNDVSISFSCEGTSMGGTIDLLEKGVPLPYSKKDILVQSEIKCDFIRTKELKVSYRITTDNDIITNKSIIVPTDGIFMALIRIIFAAIGIAVFDIPKIIYTIITDGIDAVDPEILNSILDYTADVKLEPDIEVNDEGIISVSGKISIDGTEVYMPKTTI